MKEPSRIPLTDNPRIKEPVKIPLKTLDDWEIVTTNDCSGLILAKKNENNRENNTKSIQQLESE
jgi:hypothetical protein